MDQTNRSEHEVSLLTESDLDDLSKKILARYGRTAQFTEAERLAFMQDTSLLLLRQVYELREVLSSVPAQAA